MVMGSVPISKEMGTDPITEIYLVICQGFRLYR